jgi:hypothetical protein
MFLFAPSFTSPTAPFALSHLSHPLLWTGDIDFNGFRMLLTSDRQSDVQIQSRIWHAALEISCRARIDG